MAETRSWGWRLARSSVAGSWIGDWRHRAWSSGAGVHRGEHRCVAARGDATGELDAGADRAEGPGLFRPGLPPGGTSAETRMPKPLALEIQTRLVFNERIVAGRRDETVQLATSDRRSRSDGAWPPSGGR